MAYAFGVEKYGASGLLASSEGRGWSGLSAELRRHSGGTVPWIGRQYDTEVCVSTRDSHAVVTRRGSGILDSTPATQGTAWLSPAGLQDVSIDISDPVPEILHIHLPPDHFSSQALGCTIDHAAVASSLRHESGVHDPLLAGIAHAIASELLAETSAGRLLVDTLAATLAARLLQSHAGRTTADMVATRSSEGLDRRRLSRVIDYIDENLEGDLTLGRLATVACLSRYHFARAFKAAVGRSPHRYVSEKRLERAKALLTAGDLPLVDIALSLQFSCQANFSRAFREVTGVTPGQYRRQTSA